jgi:hypothetical protein
MTNSAEDNMYTLSLNTTLDGWKRMVKVRSNICHILRQFVHDSLLYVLTRAN